MGCFSALLGGNRKKSKDGNKKVSYAKSEWQKVKPVESMDGTDAAPIIVCKGGVESAPASDTKVVAAELACPAAAGRGDDIHGDTTRPVLPNVDLVGGTESIATDSSGGSTDGADKDAIISSAAPDDGIVSGAALPNTPSRLQRSCSNIETGRRSGWKAFGDMLPPAKSRSHDDLVGVAMPAGSLLTSPNVNGEQPGGASPASSTYSADRVMLKRRSSSQVLPSRSRKLWWSHRNLHRPAAATTPAFPPPSGANKKNKEIAAAAVEEEPTVPNQWVAFSASSSLDRVSAWVSSSLIHAVGEEEDCIMEIGESSGTTKGHVPQARRADDAVQASSIVQTLNAFSTMAHVSGMGLKVVPVMSAFSSLRAVNLSGNFIGHISPGSLPKGVHSLDLSRNNIATIEGLRELTRLRVLSLSYNRISRIGHGLSSCTAIRELYLAGNKISDVEGLHRLLKLAVLDMSFNKVTTARGLGQLVANYGSLRALNLLGNPVQANVGDDTLRKAVSGLLPRLEYLNRQAVRPLRAREAAKDSVARAALGNSRPWSSRRRASSSARRSSQSPGSSSKSRERAGSSRSRSMNRVQSTGAIRQ